MPAISPGRWCGRTWVTDGPIDNAEPYLRCLADHPASGLWPVLVFPDERCNAADWLDREPAL